MRAHRYKLKAIAAAALLGPTLAVGSAHADFFDAIGRIFGGDPAPAPAAPAYQPAPYLDEGSPYRPLDMTVRPRQAQKRHVAKKPARPSVEDVVETADMDPVKNPTWYLDDPTLRYGDIVVLKGEVLVYEGDGRGRHAREEFASLERSRLPASEKQKLREMAGITVLPQVAKSQPTKIVAAVTQD